MNSFNRLPIVVGMLFLTLGSFGPAWAHEGAAAPGPVPEMRSGAEPAIDPVMRALLIGLAARILTEAARGPDPMGTLGDSMERALASALRSPASARMLEDLLGHALKDVPPELRGPLALFAGSMFESVRREMLDKRRPRAP